MTALLPLQGKTALVTGISDRWGLELSVAAKLASLGASIVMHHHRSYGFELPWEGEDLDEVRAELSAHLTEGAHLADIPADLSSPSVITDVIAAAATLTGGVDLLVCTYAKSGEDVSILDVGPERLNAFWEANTRSTLLLTAEFARHHARRIGANQSSVGSMLNGVDSADKRRAHVFWMTPGQLEQAPRGEAAYATSMAALIGATSAVASELRELGIILNTITAGPADTGYLDTEADRLDVDHDQDLPVDVVEVSEGVAGLIGRVIASEERSVVGRVLGADDLLDM